METNLEDNINIGLLILPFILYNKKTKKNPTRNKKKKKQQKTKQKKQQQQTTTKITYSNVSPKTDKNEQNKKDNQNDFFCECNEVSIHSVRQDQDVSLWYIHLCVCVHM